jgi:hypothetical protein
VRTLCPREVDLRAFKLMLNRTRLRRYQYAYVNGQTFTLLHDIVSSIYSSLRTASFYDIAPVHLYEEYEIMQ